MNQPNDDEVAPLQRGRTRRREGNCDVGGRQEFSMDTLGLAGRTDEGRRTEECRASARPLPVRAGQAGPVDVARFVLQDQYASRGALLIQVRRVSERSVSWPVGRLQCSSKQSALPTSTADDDVNWVVRCRCYHVVERLLLDCPCVVLPSALSDKQWSLLELVNKVISSRRLFNQPYFNWFSCFMFARARCCVKRNESCIAVSPTTANVHMFRLRLVFVSCLNFDRSINFGNMLSFNHKITGISSESKFMKKNLLIVWFVHLFSTWSLSACQDHDCNLMCFFPVSCKWLLNLLFLSILSTIIVYN